ncbi:hypothetical protein NDU88_001590 [Pleurodeles waltl]|uniref:Uncharacterized protein n=1 Tax=Pleurodeles waltl TaxID=8319 RepID=A0AAV7MP61_PLEWA|nr:hypothetical protein NDU88_001590 [Pleurodeles waltl]
MARRRSNPGEEAGFGVGSERLLRCGRPRRTGGACAAALAADGSESRGRGRGGPSMTKGAASVAHAAKATQQARPPQAGGGARRSRSPKKRGQGELSKCAGRREGQHPQGGQGHFCRTGGSDLAGQGGQALVGGSAQGMVSEARNSGDSSSAGSVGDRELSHILEWSKDEAQGLEDDGITLKVRPPSRTYERRWGGVAVEGARGAVSSDSEGVELGEEVSCKARGQVQREVSMLTDTLGLLQQERSVSAYGDPGGLVAASAPWEKEKAGPVRLAGWNHSALAGGAGQGTNMELPDLIECCAHR